jgi:hypothetical protein
MPRYQSRFQGLVCDDTERRARLRDKSESLNGIDYIEVSADSLHDQRFINVFFFKDVTTADLKDAKRFSIQGGVRIKDIKVLRVLDDLKDPRHIIVEVDSPGDFSTYALAMDNSKSDLDPAYAGCEFLFKAGCPSPLDCKPGSICPQEQLIEPTIDYMAKDYASFRQALMDLMPNLMPGWREAHEADLGIALVELLAYTADQLSYYQDAVANEAFLETARQRISVRRHARLIDYQMHDGVSAQAFVHLSVRNSGTLHPQILPKDTQVLSRIDKPLGPNLPPHGPVISSDMKDDALRAAGAIFETANDAPLHPLLNEIEIYTWGGRQFCLPRNTNSVDLAGDLAFDKLAANPDDRWKLKKGDFLLFEEIKSPQNGEPKDANPRHRQAVRLTNVERREDPLEKKVLTHVTWDRADALAFPLCVSAKLVDGSRAGEYDPKISVARGNLVLASHGCTHKEIHFDPDKNQRIVSSRKRPLRIQLKEGPLSFCVPSDTGEGDLKAVKDLFRGDSRQARPQINTLEINGERWKAVTSDLLSSSRFDPHFTVETDNLGRASLRFGCGEYGRQPPAGSKIDVTYRVGVGSGGNVGADSLVHIVRPNGESKYWPDISPIAVDLPMPVRNPLPAWGGIDPESIEQVKQLSAASFHAELLRAVTEEDYARAAEKHPAVSRAMATFRWTGSWHTVFVAIDPKDRTDLPAEVEESIRGWITSYMQTGYDLKIDPPTYIPLKIEIEVCVSPNHFRSHVEEALLSALSSWTRPDGTVGFFHPDKFTFEQPLYLSKLYSAIKKVEGVDSSSVKRFIRWDEPDPEPERPGSQNNLEKGYISAGRLEVLRLDNDPSFPENGVLQLKMLGGR